MSLPIPNEFVQDKNVSDQQLIFIYDKLRSEILQNDGSNLQQLNYVLVAIGAIMSFSFKVENITLKLMLLCLNIGISYMALTSAMQRIRGTFMIASYLRHVIEPKLKCIQWETDLNYLRSGQTYSRFEPIQYSLLIGYLVVAILNFGLILFYVARISTTYYFAANFVYSFDIETKIKEGICAVNIAFYLVFKMCFWCYVRFSKYVHYNEKSFGYKWKKIVLLKKMK